MCKLVNVLMNVFVETWRRGGVKMDFVLTNARSACFNALTHKRKNGSTNIQYFSLSLQTK
jgi:hypothetical protein